MQRIGRVDRRMNPEVEKQLVADHPEIAPSRGKVSFWNFLPPEELGARLRHLPGTTFSGRKRPARGARGVFFCYALPALDKEAGEFTEEAGTTRWYLYDLDRDAILGEPGEIVASIRSKPKTPRKCTTEEKTLIDLRTRVEKHIKNTYLKRVDAPVAVKPALRCWMELC